MRLDEPVVVVEAHHGVLGVPRHVDHLGCGEEARREETEGEMGLDKPPLVLILQHLGSVPVTLIMNSQLGPCQRRNKHQLGLPYFGLDIN